MNVQAFVRCCYVLQWCDYGGWFDRKELTFKRIVDTVILAAMGPPGGGRNQISPRLVRHFSLINCPPLDDGTVQHIFGSIFKSFLRYWYNDCMMFTLGTC